MECESCFAHPVHLCEGCGVCAKCCVCDDYDADELGLDPEELYDA